MGIAFGTFFADLICFGLATVVEAPPCHLRIPGARVNVVLSFLHGRRIGQILLCIKMSFINVHFTGRI